MSRNEIITTIKGRKEAPLKQYSFPTEKGEFIGILKYRAWGRKSALLCYFDTDDGKNYVLSAWWNREYMPRQTQISFADDVVNGTRWRCTFEISKGGSTTTWLTAEML